MRKSFVSFLLIFLFSNFYSPCFSQSKLDSLEAVIAKTKGKEKILKIFKLTNLCRDIGREDKCLPYVEEALKIAIEIKDLSKQADCYNELGLYYHYKLAWDKVLENYLKALNIFEQ